MVPPPNYQLPSPFLGYPQLLGAALHVNVVDAACPGETSASLIKPSAPRLHCEDTYRRLFPFARPLQGLPGGVRVVAEEMHVVERELDHVPDPWSELTRAGRSA